VKGVLEVQPTQNGKSHGAWGRGPGRAVGLIHTRLTHGWGREGGVAETDRSALTSKEVHIRRPTNQRTKLAHSRGCRTGCNSRLAGRDPAYSTSQRSSGSRCESEGRCSQMYPCPRTATHTATGGLRGAALPSDSVSRYSWARAWSMIWDWDAEHAAARTQPRMRQWARWCSMAWRRTQRAMPGWVEDT
jgi:hypothetical protein